MNSVHTLLTTRMSVRVALAFAILAAFAAFAMQVVWKETPRQRADVEQSALSPEKQDEGNPILFPQATQEHSPDAPATNMQAGQPQNSGGEQTAIDTAHPPPAGQTPQTAEQKTQTAPVVIARANNTPLSWQPLIARLNADGINTTYTKEIFSNLNNPPLPEFMGQKAVELYGRYGKAELAVSEMDKIKFAPPDYTRIAGGMTVAAGRRAMTANKAYFEGLYKRYGVPAPFIIAVLMVETGLGAEMGRQPALLALGSMAATATLQEVLPAVNGITSHHQELDALIQARSDWAYNELKALIQYAKNTGKHAWTIPGSVYGAIGMCQFMPSNIPLYGASSSKNRPVPDVFIFSDAAASVARYLSAHGWKNATTPQTQVGVLRSYNHSDVYASTVYGVASALMSPTTHTSAQSARTGGNAVKAARENARASIPSGKKGKPLEELPDYKKLLE